MGHVVSFPKPAIEKVAFQRREMSQILDVYGKLVMAGEARDYSIGCYKDLAVFAIFRRHAEQPNWRIEKVPALRNRQGMYAIFGAQGQMLKRGHELSTVLSVFEARRFDVL